MAGGAFDWQREARNASIGSGFLEASRNGPLQNFASSSPVRPSCEPSQGYPTDKPCWIDLDLFGYEQPAPAFEQMDSQGLAFEGSNCRIYGYLRVT